MQPLLTCWCGGLVEGRGRKRRAGRGRTKKVALVQERRPVKTAMRVVECMVVVVVVLVVVVVVLVVVVE
jgi:hypothetical protein